MHATTNSDDTAPSRYFSAFIEGRRGEILDAALGVFGEKGYEAGTMRAIARRVGVTEPALYRHYEGKEAILADIVATAGDRIAGEMRAALDAVSGENIVPMLNRLIEMRRRSLVVEPATADGARVNRDAPEPPSIQSGVGGVLGVLIHAAPHNKAFIGLLQEHLGQPMAQAIRAAVPRIDSSFGTERTPEDLEGKVRVLMSLFAGYFTTSLVFDAPPNDRAIVDAVLAIMGWHEQGAATVQHGNEVDRCGQRSNA